MPEKLMVSEIATLLPYIDEHAIEISAPHDAVRAAVERYAAAATTSDHPILSRLLGTESRAAFSTASCAPGEPVSLEGRHRFAEYRLVFDLSGAGARTTLRAITYARFRGLHGRLYRALLLVSGGHAFETKRTLRSIKRLVTPHDC